jgi:uncharacterized membrane protein YkvA (DUF1232 family)
VIALLVGLATALAAAVAVMFIAAAVAAPRGMPIADVLRVYPDLARLLVSLARDRRVARAVRWRLMVALAYNAQPINLIPDFIPVIGLADNVLITGWAVRSAIRKSGPDIVLSNWRGSEARLALVCRLCRLKVLPASHLGEDPELDTPAMGSDLPVSGYMPQVSDICRPPDPGVTCGNTPGGGPAQGEEPGLRDAAASSQLPVVR